MTTFAFICPILPEMTDLSVIFTLLEGKVGYVFGEPLNTRCGNMPQILRAVSSYDRRLRATFEREVKDRRYWESVEEEFHDLAEKHGIEVAGFFHHVDIN